jgi:hypothetical protein
MGKQTQDQMLLCSNALFVIRDIHPEDSEGPSWPRLLTLETHHKQMNGEGFGVVSNRSAWRLMRVLPRLAMSLSLATTGRA